jgi:dipeptidyl aminopeptidase/acylaminoacyl peptidase
LATKVKYDAPSGKLTAYVTTIPQDGQKHPAIVWISGGDCNSIDDAFFQESPPNNDQTASAFRTAGVVTMYPSLRGGNDNPGFKEAFFGEVDDVIAAADFLSKLDGIDPNRIYLGGHSTGGTLVFLVAASTSRFRAVFSFGPVEDIRGYGSEFTPFNSRDSKEFDLRSPLKWVDSIQSRTFVLEGMRRPGNASSLAALSKASHNANVSFLAVKKANHFNILAPTTKMIADKIVLDNGPATNIVISESELNLNYAP